MKIMLSHKEVQAVESLFAAAKNFARKLDESTVIHCPTWIKAASTEDGGVLVVKESVTVAICEYFMTVCEGLGTVTIVAKTFVQSVLMPKAEALAEFINHEDKKEEGVA